DQRGARHDANQVLQRRLGERNGHLDVTTHDDLIDRRITELVNGNLVGFGRDFDLDATLGETEILIVENNVADAKLDVLSIRCHEWLLSRNQSLVIEYSTRRKAHLQAKCR